MNAAGQVYRELDIVEGGRAGLYRQGQHYQGIKYIHPFSCEAASVDI